MKPKRCKQCNEPFTPQRMGQKVCSPACAIPYARNQSEKSQKMLAKAERMADREKRESMRPLKWFHARTKRAVHKYIRTRDADQPCISCGTTHAAQWDA
ncbi:MAG: recombination protein NinG, partial [Burkholderiales bacterium]|nr:recombination protein NinG [Burkholderiales bacterium]